MQAIILASGKGIRMQPYTLTKNKVMFKVDGKPLLQHHIENLIRIGVKHIYVTASWQAKEIKELCLKYPEITIYNEEKLIGSWGACRNIIERYNLDRIIIIYGDTWYTPSFYDNIPHLYRNKKNYIFVQNINQIPNINRDKLTGLILYKKDDNKIVEIDENGKLLEHKKQYKIGKNIGIIVISKITIPNYTIRPMDLMNDYLPIVIRHLPQPNEMYAEEFEGYIISGFPNFSYWCDIGSLDRYISLNLHFYKSTNVNWLLEYHYDKIIEFTKKILLANRIFVCGNGGSFSTSQHLALDWSKVGKKETIALDSPCAITAYGNDEGYENVFLSQLKRYKVNKNDVIVLISGSGNSPNIVKIIENYSEKNVLLGMSGEKGKLIELVKLTLPVPSDNIRVIEDAHLSYGHAITEIMDGLN